MTEKHNPSAFPTPQMKRVYDIQDIPPSIGMSLRDYFAGQALAGGIAFEQEDGCLRTPSDTAHLAYRIADAMIVARNEA